MLWPFFVYSEKVFRTPFVAANLNSLNPQYQHVLQSGRYKFSYLSVATVRILSSICLAAAKSLNSLDIVYFYKNVCLVCIRANVVANRTV